MATTYRLAQRLRDIDDYLAPVFARGCEFIAMDTEASSLNTRRAKIAGISISHTPKTAIYIPLGHQIGTNLPKDAVVKKLNEYWGEHDPTTIFWNTKYDLNILQANIGWIPNKHLDGIELVYLDNPDKKQKGLKIIGAEMGIDMTRFEDIFTAEEIKSGVLDISTKSPVRCTDYACADADVTLIAFEKYRHMLDEQPFAIKIDTHLVDVIRKIEHNGGLKLNIDYIEQCVTELRAREEALREQIHRMAGVAFEINSPKQLGDILFERLGIPSPGLTRGKRPQHRTGAEDLEKLAKTYPICEFVISYRKVSKAERTYFDKLKYLDQTGMPVRFNFNMYSAPTFRLSAPGGDPKKDGATGLNIQAVSNGEARDIMAVNLSAIKGSLEKYDLDEEDDLLGADANLVKVLKKKQLFTGKKEDLAWTSETEDGALVCFRETCDGCPANCEEEGIDITRRLVSGVKMIPSVRQSFQAPEGYTMVSFDYDRQEMVIGANLSGEPKWLTALANKEDLHKITASDAFGVPLDKWDDQEEYIKIKRRNVGKVLNFATFYGATAYTLARKADITQAAAESIYDSFKKGMQTLFNWMAKVHSFARKEGYTTTYFGRKRYLHQFYNSSDRKMHAFADRSAVNTAVQGTGAEVTRIAMVKVDKGLKKKGYTNKQIKMVMQLHDELSFLIRDDMLKELIPIVQALMEFKVKSWVVQLTVGAKAGKIWGQQKDWDFETNDVKVSKKKDSTVKQWTSNRSKAVG